MEWIETLGKDLASSFRLYFPTLRILLSSRCTTINTKKELLKPYRFLLISMALGISCALIIISAAISTKQFSTNARAMGIHKQQSPPKLSEADAAMGSQNTKESLLNWISRVLQPSNVIIALVFSVVTACIQSELLRRYYPHAVILRKGESDEEHIVPFIYAAGIHLLICAAYFAVFGIVIAFAHILRLPLWTASIVLVADFFVYRRTTRYFMVVHLAAWEDFVLTLQLVAVGLSTTIALTELVSIKV